MTLSTLQLTKRPSFIFQCWFCDTDKGSSYAFQTGNWLNKSSLKRLMRKLQNMFRLQHLLGAVWIFSLNLGCFAYSFSNNAHRNHVPITFEVELGAMLPSNYQSTLNTTSIYETWTSSWHWSIRNFNGFLQGFEVAIVTNPAKTAACPTIFNKIYKCEFMTFFWPSKQNLST